jgi:hypothetical protein
MHALAAHLFHRLLASQGFDAGRLVGVGVLLLMFAEYRWLLPTGPDPVQNVGDVVYRYALVAVFYVHGCVAAEIVVRSLEQVMVMEGFTRGPDGTLISPDGKVILAP